MVHISLHGESEPPDVLTSQTLVNHETLKISEEEPTTPCPRFFLVPMMVPPHNDNEVGKFAHPFLIHLLTPVLLLMIQIQWRKFHIAS